MPELRIDRLSKTFQRTEALREVSLDVADGQFVSFVGASGCGKSTLLRLVDGLIPASEGSVLLGGSPVTGPGNDRAMVFQEDRLLPWRTIERNVVLGLEFQGQSKRDSLARARELLQLTGIGKFGSAYPHELSGGMRQRANIARALAVDPDVLLMDEPFAALDGQTRELMQAELVRIWQDSRKTVLFVTHQVDEAVYLSDRIVVLTARPGRVKADIEVALPRPRTLATKRSAEFAGYVERVWSLIEEEVRESMEREMRDA
ncbi:ABC transporter ATP-binding protein [Amycolatopsis suaedae]|uniref:ABC transporter ATP-binding protein n=1 Tax=Amycolatopsis suaedae TaxID=2510978 RepID=A0A4Q7J2M3_9PSEU|nr:ABC transporter ATP-binding protein [Amycolatopsis suaedae]RZQ60806.1 ABC transporter ATP-binding protein [Amycolatopsis suaedae]